jgi:hypothetical protein
VIVDPTTLGQGVFLQDGQGVGHADLFQQVERRFVNAFYVPVGQGRVAATRKARAHDGFTWSRPSCSAGLVAPGALCHAIPRFQDIGLIGLNVIIPSVVGEAE